VSTPRAALPNSLCSAAAFEAAGAHVASQAAISALPLGVIARLGGDASSGSFSSLVAMSSEAVGAAGGSGAGTLWSTAAVMFAGALLTGLPAVWWTLPDAEADTAAAARAVASAGARGPGGRGAGVLRFVQGLLQVRRSVACGAAWCVWCGVCGAVCVVRCVQWGEVRVRSACLGDLWSACVCLGSVLACFPPGASPPTPTDSLCAALRASFVRELEGT
jgi:hypothetical protein